MRVIDWDTAGSIFPAYWSYSHPERIMNATNMHTWIELLAHFMVASGIDGFSLDIEGPILQLLEVNATARDALVTMLTKLKERMEKLERTLRALSDRIDASSRKRPTQQVNQPMSGGTINVSGGSIDGNAHISFGEGSTMNNYLLDRLIDECWPDTPS